MGAEEIDALADAVVARLLDELSGVLASAAAGLATDGARREARAAAESEQPPEPESAPAPAPEAGAGLSTLTLDMREAARKHGVPHVMAALDAVGAAAGATVAQRLAALAEDSYESLRTALASEPAPEPESAEPEPDDELETDADALDGASVVELVRQHVRDKGRDAGVALLKAHGFKRLSDVNGAAADRLAALVAGMA